MKSVTLVSLVGQKERLKQIENDSNLCTVKLFPWVDDDDDDLGVKLKSGQLSAQMSQIIVLITNSLLRPIVGRVARSIFSPRAWYDNIGVGCKFRGNYAKLSALL